MSSEGWACLERFVTGRWTLVSEGVREMFALNVIPRVSGAIAWVRGTDGTKDPPTRLCNIPIKIFRLHDLTLKQKSILAFISISRLMNSIFVVKKSLIGIQNNITLWTLIGKCVGEMSSLNVISQISWMVWFKIETQSTTLWSIGASSNILIKIFKLVDGSYKIRIRYKDHTFK